VIKSKTLVIDGQVFQTDARDRGMGRYSAYLIRSIIEQNYYDNVQIIIKKHTNDKATYSENLNGMFFNVDVIPLNLSDTKKTKIESAFVHNKKEINNYMSGISDENTSIDYLIPCPFQEPLVSVFPDGVNKILVFYDLIPYLYHHRYKPLMQFDNYLKRFSLLIEADKILSISQSVRDDLIQYLGIPGNKIVAIDGAAIESGDAPKRPSGIEIPEKYILMPTSDDPRKNNLRAVLGFEEFRSTQHEDYKLVVTSKIHRNERTRLETFSDNLLFTGNVKENELDWLYDNCKVVLFTPESEGLGLPILEAVLNNKRVICSSINVFKEISEDAFYYCDHENQHSIASAIIRSLASKDLSIPKAKYQSISKHYSWDQTAKRSIFAIKDITLKKNFLRPKIAIFTPAPDGLSAVGKVVAEAHPMFNDYFDIDYYAEAGQYPEPTRPNYLQYIANYFPAKVFGVEKYMDYDAVIYHIGNSDYHLESICNSLYLSGYAILHDTNVSEAYRIMFEKGMISSDRNDIENQITEKSNSSMSRNIASIVNNQLGVITHSKYAADAVKEVLVNKVPIKSVNLATYCPLMTRKRNYSRLVVGLAGIIADIKGIEVIENLANSPNFNDCEIKLFGYNYASSDTIDRLRSYPNVSVSTNLTDFDFQNSISNLDVFVNYRMKYQGETSLSTLEAMRQGVVVIVRNVGWYSELPDDVVVKVNSEQEVLEKLLELRLNPDKLSDISNKAMKYVDKSHNNKQYIDGLLDLIKVAGKSNTELYNKANELKSGKIKKASQLIDYYQNNPLRERDSR